MRTRATLNPQVCPEPISAPSNCAEVISNSSVKRKVVIDLPCVGDGWVEALASGAL